MNAECLRDCSSTELLSTQKKIADILHARKGEAQFVDNYSQVPSRSSSKCNGRSKRSMKSVNYDFGCEKFNAKRSQSLINLRDDFSIGSSCVDSINKKYRQTYTEHDYGQCETEAVLDNSDGEVEDIAAKSASTSTSLSHVTYSKAQEMDMRSKQHRKLSNAVKCLYSILDDVHVNTNAPFRQRSRSPSTFFETRKIPELYEKNSVSKLAKIVDTLTKNLRKRVSQFIILRRDEKTRLDKSRDESVILKQRLNNSLNLQRNLEGELKDLNKEKKLLEMENKNLAIKIVPFLNENNNSIKMNSKSKTSGSAKREESFRQAVSKEDERNNNQIVMENEDLKKCHNSTSAPRSKSLYRCSRRSSIAGLNERYWFQNNENEPVTVSRSISDSSLTVDSTTEDISALGNKDKCRNDLDSIASYVQWKNQDFNRLHGKLNKNFEELEQLKQTMNLMSEEKREILTDLSDLVESYRELERERDNYESILKMILNEKNSSESNIRELLDGLLVHLSTPIVHAVGRRNQQHDSCPFSCSDPNHRQPCANSRSFLESALHVIQEQNISIREEMARLRESLQNTTGQNTVLQANNAALMEKFNDLQRQMESKEVESGRREKEHKEKFEQLDKLYNKILSAKEELETKLQEKEQEIARLNLKNLADASEKALKDQGEKMAELKEANSKLEKDVARLIKDNERLNQKMTQLKTESKDQKGKFTDQIKSAHSELQKSNEHCTWLQNQIENFKTQLHDAQERIKVQEKDKTILAHKVLAAEEERKTLDRNVQEIRTVMEADKLYQHALSERNEVLQSEVNRLRTEKLSGGNIDEKSKNDCQSCSAKKKEDGDDHQLRSPVTYKGTPLLRKLRHHTTRKHFDVPKATVSLHK